jgi:transglutaminase-like putative cysteine protease
MRAIPAIEGMIRNFTSAVRTLPDRPWDWPAILLAITLVQIAAARLAITEWVPSLNVTQLVSLSATVLGVLLGYSAFTRRQAIWAAAEYGVLIISLQLLSTTERTESTYEDLRHLYMRLSDSFSLFVQGQPVHDTIFFVFFSCMVFWVVGIYSGYRFTRQKSFLDVVLIPGLIVLSIQIYDPWMPLRAWGLALYIFAALALLGRLYYLDSHDRWRKQHIFLSSDSEWEFSRSILLTAALLVATAWVLPGMVSNIQPVSEAWKSFTRPLVHRLSDAVSALDSPYGNSVGGDFYTTELKLGGNAPVSDALVFNVHVKSEDVNVLRYYWRGRVYDRYENGQWTTTSSLRQNFDPEETEITLIHSANRIEVDLEVTVNFPKQELLYGPSEMTWTSEAGRTIVQRVPNETAFEVTAWLTDTALGAGDRYEVRALIANPTIQDLRAAGTNYPAWVTESYLQVPEVMRPQLKELAEEITANYIIPYDKVQAITSYLRHEIEYETKITGVIPPGEDPLLWVLFDHKKGFCMYYASAQVLLLRTLGIPARMAVGFAQGEYDSGSDRYEVARLNSHAWPEIYFPGIGWVEFEPTSNEAILNRPQAPSEAEEDAATGGLQNSPPLLEEEELENLPGFDPTLAEEDLTVTSAVNLWERYIPPAMFLVLIAVGLFLAKRYSLGTRLPVYLSERYRKGGSQPPTWLSNWVKWSSLLPIERSFHTINLSLRWLGKPRSAHATPAERARTLAKALPAVHEAIAHLAHEYETALFTSRPANLSVARHASLRIILETWRTRLFHYKEYLKRRYN